MKPDEYGEKYPDHLLEQYKLYVEMADRVSQRRDQSNRFYVTIVSALAAIVVIIARFGVPANGALLEVAFLVIGLFGFALSIVWHFNIRSYRILNSAKFRHHQPHRKTTALRGIQRGMGHPVQPTARPSPIPTIDTSRTIRAGNLLRAFRCIAGDKILTLVASALAGGDCIDDADALRAGGTERVLGCTVKAPSTLGTFLRSFRWGHVRQLDRVSRELLARAWDAGVGPGDSPLTIDLDSTICETYGLAKEGARRHNYTGQRGYHPLLAIAAGTGDVLMARLRQGRANTARGAAHFLRETVARVRHAGAIGQLTVRADSGFYARDIVTVCRNNDVRFSITVRQHRSLRDLIERIPEQEWTPIPYWMEGAADVAETTYTPFRGDNLCDIPAIHVDHDELHGGINECVQSPTGKRRRWQVERMDRRAARVRRLGIHPRRSIRGSPRRRRSLYRGCDRGR